MPSRFQLSRRRVAVALGAVVLGTLTLASTVTRATHGPSATALPVADPSAYVDPLIGTANAGNDFPGADMPFGMVQWSPDTLSRPDGGGYSYGDSSISGFSLTHLSGTGCPVAGDIPVLPTLGGVDPSASDWFSHSSEYATAGYYKVALHNGVTTQLTATTRTGMAQFAFPSSSAANLIFKLDDSQNGDSATSFAVVSDAGGHYEVQGSAESGGFCGSSTKYTVYFDMQFSQPFASWGSYSRGGLQPGSAGSPAPADPPAPAAPGALPPQPDHAAYYLPLESGQKTAALLDGPQGAYVTFHTSSARPLLAKVGLSYVSAADAKANLHAENPGWNFAATREAARASWNALLGKVRLSGGTTGQRRVFYTALYHALQYPNVFSDDNGKYTGMDGKVHTVDARHSAFYTDISGWDIYRGQAQLEALVDPSAASDAAQSMLDDYAQTGRLPKWPAENGESYEMVGDPADEVLADYYAFGATGFDTSAALKDMVSQATKPNTIRPGGEYLRAPGYLPVDGSYGCCDYRDPVSTSLEYDTSDFAISAFAGALGNTSDQREFANLAQDWRTVLNPASGFVQPRDANGNWAGGFTPARTRGFAEGDSWIYTGMVPFDLAGLTAAKGGQAAMIAYLNTALGSYIGADGYAYLGNEPSIELPWEYDYVGEPYQTQQTVRQIQDQLWTPTPGGTGDGNDDLGAMSAWYVWSALGMYPMTPGTADLALGSPLFPKAVLTLQSGATLTVIGNGAAAASPYVQAAAWNGSAWNEAYAPANAISRGGTLTFWLSGHPDPAWAAKPGEAPPSYGGDVVTPPAPQTGTVVTALAAGQCLDAGSYSPSAMAANPVELTPCDGSDAQQWTFAPDGTVRALGMCLDAGSTGPTQSAPARLSPCDGTSDQQWVAGALGTLVNPSSGLCLDDAQSPAAPDAGLQIEACNSSGAPGWKVPRDPARRSGPLTSGSSARVCADEQPDGTHDSTPIVAGTCASPDASSWVAEADGTYRLLGECMNASRNRHTRQTVVDLAPCDGTGSQQWTATTSGQLINSGSGLCLAARPAAHGRGRQLQLATCNGSARQVWNLRS